jgi:CRP-like cAMP-binding protein
MDDKISPIINSTSSVSRKSIEKIKGLIEYTIVKKGELITSVGKHNTFEYFLIKGICKSFLFTPEGEDVTLSFFMSNSIISPYTTRVKEGKSILNLRALTDVELGNFNAAQFEKLMIEDLEIRHFGNTVLRNELMNKVQKEIALASLKGKDRLQLLRTNFPNIENLAPHSDIASYLGITTISLSRLRTNS